jgi:cysteine desulfurase/selenocysteine lyase
LRAGSEREVVFTYGTTSSINLLAHCLSHLFEPGDEILLSILEHHSNLVPWQKLAERRGATLRFLPMTQEGRLDLNRLETELTNRCRLVALTHCSNVTGALTDVPHANSLINETGCANNTWKCQAFSGAVLCVPAKMRRRLLTC